MSAFEVDTLSASLLLSGDIGDYYMLYICSYFESLVTTAAYCDTLTSLPFLRDSFFASAFVCLYYIYVEVELLLCYAILRELDCSRIDVVGVRDIGLTPPNVV